MSGLDARTDGLTQGGVYQHHLTGAGEFSTGEMGNFQPALTQLRPGEAAWETVIGGPDQFRIDPRAASRTR